MGKGEEGRGGRGGQGESGERGGGERVGEEGEMFRVSQQLYTTHI